MYIYDKDKLIAYAIPITYLILAVIYLISVSTPMKNEDLNSHENIFTIMDIYGVNKDIIQNHDIDLSNEEINFLKDAITNLNEENNYTIVGDPEQIYWIYSFTQEIKENEITKKHGGQAKFNWTFLEYKNLIEDSKYIIYFENTVGYNLNKDQILNSGKVIYSNETGGIRLKENL